MEQGRQAYRQEPDQFVEAAIIDVPAFITDADGELVAEVAIVASAYDVETNFEAEDAAMTAAQREVPGPVRVANPLVEKIVSESQARRDALKAEADAMAAMSIEDFQDELFTADLVDGVQEEAVDNQTGVFPEVDAATEGGDEPVITTATTETDAFAFDDNEADAEVTARLANIEEAELVMRSLVNAEDTEDTEALTDRFYMQAELLGDLALILETDQVDISELTDDAKAADIADGLDEGAEESALLAEERTLDDELQDPTPETTESRLGGFVLVRAVEVSGDDTFAEDLQDLGREFKAVALYALTAYRQRQELQADVALVA